MNSNEDEIIEITSENTGFTLTLPRAKKGMKLSIRLLNNGSVTIRGPSVIDLLHEGESDPKPLEKSEAEAPQSKDQP